MVECVVVKVIPSSIMCENQVRKGIEVDKDDEEDGENRIKEDLVAHVRAKQRQAEALNVVVLIVVVLILVIRCL